MKKDPLIGQRLANFLVDRPLGRGGMAQVYYGVDTSLERPVAIKVIDARYQGDPEYARRFVDEAKLVARWRHENIVQVFYAGNQGDVYFFAMEYIDGMSLEALMERYLENGTLMPHEEVLKIGRAIASSLDYAHKQGVVHRDIKPSNIMVSRDDRVVLMDFGLALDMGQGSMGQVFGTPHYISPEQARKSSDAVAQSDIYSFGVVLYEMLVGAIPFDDPSAASVAVQHITQEPPPPSLLNPALSYDIEKVLLKALAKAPQDRYQTATAMLDALATAIANSTKPDAASTAILPPAVMSGQSPKLSRMSISELMAFDLDADEDEPTAQSMRALNPVHRLETQETTVPPQFTRPAKQAVTKEVKAIKPAEVVEESPEIVPIPEASSRRGMFLGLGALVIIALIAVIAFLLMNLGGNNTTLDTAATETEASANASASQAALDTALINATNAQTEEIVDEPTVQPTATDDLGSTATSIIMTNDAINLENTSIASTNASVLGQQTADSSLAQTQTANDALATSNANLELTLTAQFVPSQTIPSQSVQATSPAFANGLPIEIIYNGAGIYLRNSGSEANIRLDNLIFRALDANGNSVGNEFNGDDWTRFYSNVDRNGRCVSIELLDQASWNRPNNCVDYNSQLTFPTNDQRIFWDGRNGASQFAVIWNGTEAGRCAIADGFCSILVGR